MTEFATDFTTDELMTSPARFSTPMTVRFQEIDAAGIVFYPRFFEYFHDAYALAMAQAGAPIHRAVNAREWAAPLKRVTADYFRPLRFGDPFTVAIVGVKIEGTDVHLGYRIELPGGAVAAVGTALHVFIDPKTFRRAPALPDEVRAALRPLVVLEVQR
jgi:1,4-dihydroxy-2-naphthoyl-CoA hydrolase